MKIYSLSMLNTTEKIASLKQVIFLLLADKVARHCISMLCEGH